MNRKDIKVDWNFREFFEQGPQIACYKFLITISD